MLQLKLKTLLKPCTVDALFFATNTLAVAGLKEINRLGIKVPMNWPLFLLMKAML
jgi:DNA-binding LacI/PurR family transcriptional regulator